MIELHPWARASGDGAGAQDAEITPPILDVPSTRGSRAQLPSAERIAFLSVGVAIHFSYQTFVSTYKLRVGLCRMPDY